MRKPTWTTWAVMLGVVLWSAMTLAAPAFNYLATPMDVSPGSAGTWVDVDVSASVPPGATGVLVLVHNQTGSDRSYGLRKKGSTDPWDAESILRDARQTWLMTGLDPSRVFQIYTSSPSVDFYLYAYTMGGVQFFTNRIDKSIGSTGVWTDVDISADTGGNTAIGAIFTVLNRSSSARLFGLRMKGSGDSRFSEMDQDAATLGLIGVDASEVAQLQVESTLVELHLVGYVTEGAVFFTNGVNKSTSTTGSFVDVDITADIGTNRANGAFIEHVIADNTRHRAAVRRNGDTEDYYLDQKHGFASIGIDASNIFEQKIDDTNMDLYLVGYSLEETNLVRVFTARSTSGENKLEWLNPSVGPYASTKIVKRTDQCPTGATDVLATPVTDQSTALGGKDSFPDGSLTNGTTYYYGAYVDEGGGVDTPGKCVMGRPFDTSAIVKWSYTTGATSLAPPGLRFSGGLASVFVVSNDSIAHSMEAGDLGGSWPTLWKPYVLGGVAQSRPPAVGFAVGSAAQGAAFLGAQDGQVYAVNAEDGSLAWKRMVATMVQAAPAGHFIAYDAGAFDLVLVGTRNGGGAANSFEALDVNTGAPAWSFTNSSAQGGDDALMGIISGGASMDYASKRVYFASREHGGGSLNTLWCLSFDALNPTLERAWALGDIDGSPIFFNGCCMWGRTRATSRLWTQR